MKSVWNLNDLYESGDQFDADLAKAENLLNKLSKFKGTLSQPNKENILNYFKLDDQFSIIFEKLVVFAHCKRDDDGKNPQNLSFFARVNAFYTKVCSQLSFARAELSGQDLNFLKSLLADAEFSDYSRTIEDVVRLKKHTLLANEERVLSEVASFSDTDDIYDSISDVEMEHGSFVDENGNNIKLTTGNYSLHLKNPNQEIRKQVMENYLFEYKKFNITFSNLYLSHLKLINFLAKEHKYSSALDMMTYEEEVSPEIMLFNIDQVSAKVGLLQDYFKTKQKILKLKTFYTSDISVGVSGDLGHEPFEQAVSDIRASFLPLGEDYQAVFDKALSDGWIDALPRENKASGGYTISAYASHPYILLNYDGTAYWKSAIAHEFGHAMHSFYSSQSQPVAKAQYTIFVAEIASLTNEILFTKFMLKKENNKQKKMQIIVEFLQLFYLNVFNSTMLAEFEKYAHDTLFEGGFLTAEKLNEKYVSLAKKYFGESVVLTENFEFDWQRKSHIFRDYYLYKYSTGLVSACAVATKLLSDKTGEYTKKYKKFLSLGGSTDPISSLKVAEIDITKKETFDFAFDMFESFLNELKALAKEEL